MEKRVKNTIIGIVLILIGFAVYAIFKMNVFALNLPAWIDIPAMVIGIPLPIFGVALIVNTYRKKA